MNFRLFITAFLLLAAECSARQGILVHGTVTDSATGAALMAANIRLNGTTRGTITNSRGAFVLSADSAGQSFTVSYLGYEPETTSVSATTASAVSIRLKASPIRIPEVVVLAEDPALEIIRQAIAHKRVWMEKLKTYSFEAFTRQVLRHDTAIASITESYTTGYMNAGDTLREVVHQKRQTANIPEDENPAAVRKIINFNEDRIDLLAIQANSRSHRMIFTGPTAPDALDAYDFKLLKTSYMHGVEIYEIRMTPKSRFRPLFRGTISIANGTFAVMGVDISPNDLSGIPFVSDFHLHFRQEFSLYDTIFWMPSNIHIDGALRVNVPGMSFPVIGIDMLSSLSDYRINSPIPDSILAKPLLSVDSTSLKFDSSYWKTNEKIPLTVEERAAYATLDSTQTVEKQFRPRGALAGLADAGTEGLLDFADLHFNRVQGFYLGLAHTFTLPVKYATLAAGGGFGLSDHRSYYAFHLHLPVPGFRIAAVTASLFRRLANVSDGDFYGSLPISIAALLDKNDYRNYFLAQGFDAGLSFGIARRINLAAVFRDETDYSAAKATDFSVLFPSRPFRSNPPVAEGNLRSVQFSLHTGDKAEALDVISRNSADITVEYSSPGLAHSDYRYTWVSAEVNRSFATMIPDMLFPPEMLIRIAAGGVLDGTVPPQRYYTIDSRLGVYGPFGALRGTAAGELTGDRYVVISAEHNFRAIPFTLLGLSALAGPNTELLVHGSAAQSWENGTAVLPHWYGEAGIGVGRILDFLRIDLTYRITPPRSLFLTAGISTLF